MPRRPRDKAAGFHHVVVGATGPSSYFHDDIDRLMWIRLLLRMLDRYDWTCVSFCQLTTHLHAIFEIPDESISFGMHMLNMAYGKGFNDRHDRFGNLLRSRFWSKRIEDERQLLAAFRYVARNPTRAGMCERPEDWPWSSFATSCGLARAFPFVDASIVLGALHASPAAPGEALIGLVRDPHVRYQVPDVWVRDLSVVR
jgi:REP element-mobilizing transposase RayT